MIKLPQVRLKSNETDESLLRRFRKTVTNAGTLGTIREKRWHISKSEKRRMEKKKALRRARRKQHNRP